MEDHRPVRPNPRWVNKILQKARSLYHLSLGTGLEVVHTPAGRSLSLSEPDPVFMARIVSGAAGGPYRFRRQVRRGDAWIDIADRDDPAVAYQANLQTVPVGHVVRMREVGLGIEYRFATPKSGVSSGIICLPCPLNLTDPLYITADYSGWNGTHGADGLDGPVWTGAGEHTTLMLPRERVLKVGDLTDPNFTTNPYWYSQDPILEPLPGFGAVPDGTQPWHRFFLACVSVGGDNWWVLSTINHTDEPQPEWFSFDADTGVDTYTPTDAAIAPDLPPDCWQCSPGFMFGWTFMGTNNYGETISTSYTIHHGTLPPLSAEVCPTVHLPDCDGVPGAAVSGATVELFPEGETTAAVTGTTDASGHVCLPVTVTGRYDVVATDTEGNQGRAAVTISRCSGTVELDLPLCSGAFCLDVTGYYADDISGENLAHALSGAIVSETGAGFLGVTDSSGRLCKTLTSEQMMALPHAVGDCLTRVLSLDVTKSGYLYRCLTVAVPCGQTEEEAAVDPASVTLYGLKKSSGVDAYAQLPTAIASVCPTTAGCNSNGWFGRGVIPIAQDVQTDHDTYTFPIDEMDPGAGTDTYNLLGGGVGFTKRLALDLERLNDEVKTTWSPFDAMSGVPAQRVEYYGSHTWNWSSRTGGMTTSGGRLWLCHGFGLIVSHELAGYDPTDPEQAPAMDIPAGLPENGPIGTVPAVLLHYPFDFDVCDLGGQEANSFVANALDDNRDRDWTIRTTPGTDL